MKNNAADKPLCPVCGQGHTEMHTEQVAHSYTARDGQVYSGQVPMHYSVCDTCHSDFAGEAEARLNKRAVVAFRKQAEGLLGGAEILALRKRFNINQKQAGILFGGGPVAFSKYENDEIAHVDAVDSLMRVALANETAFWSLVELKGLAAQLPRPVRMPARVYRHSSKVLTVEFTTTSAIAHDFVPLKTIVRRDEYCDLPARKVA